jgi:hypothetical protein
MNCFSSLYHSRRYISHNFINRLVQHTRWGADAPFMSAPSRADVERRCDEILIIGAVSLGMACASKLRVVNLRNAKVKLQYRSAKVCSR